MRNINSIIFTIVFCFVVTTVTAQVGINTDEPKATLDVVGTDKEAAGILAPRITRTKLISLDSYYQNEQEATLLYITEIGSETKSTKTINISNSGYYFFDGSVWQPFWTNPWYKVGTTRPSTNNTDNSYISAKIAIGTNKPANINGEVENADLTVIKSAVIDTIDISRGKTGQTNIAIGKNTIANSNSGSDYNLAVGDSVLYSNTNGSYNIGIGLKALKTNKTGSKNVAIGYGSLGKSTASNNIAIGVGSLLEQKSGNDNIALGSYTLETSTTNSNAIAIGTNALRKANSNATRSLIAIGKDALSSTINIGTQNIAIGSGALKSSTIGSSNIAVGNFALLNNNSQKNTSIGHYTLYYNTKGGMNTAIGERALYSNIEGSGNLAIGEHALYSNIEGAYNLALSREALFSNTTGVSNIAFGYRSLYGNTIGLNNIAIGTNSGSVISTGNNNTVIGYNAMSGNNGDNNTVIGNNSAPTNSTQLNNITALGASITVTGKNSTGIGYGAVVTTDNTIVLGNSNITKIQGAVTMTTFSDKRFKKDIKENVPGLDFIKKLRPVTYRIDTKAIANGLNIPENDRNKNQEALKSKVIQTGFIAQDVEQAANEIGYNFSGIDIPKDKKDYYGLHYSEFVVPLIKSIKEQQVIIEKQQQSIKQRQELIKRLEARIALLEQK